MTYKDLPQFIHALKENNQLVTIDTPVDPDLEITEIADRVSKAYGKALLFTNVKGSNYPLIINTLGTYERLSMGLGVNNLNDIASQIEDFMNLSAYASLVGKIKAIPKLAPLPFIFPRTVKSAPCQEVIEEPDLEQLPIIKCWPQDGGKYITLPLVFTKDPENGQQNVGMYRMQVYDKKQPACIGTCIKMARKSMKSIARQVNGCLFALHLAVTLQRFMRQQLLYLK